MCASTSRIGVALNTQYACAPLSATMEKARNISSPEVNIGQINILIFFFFCYWAERILFIYFYSLSKYLILMPDQTTEAEIKPAKQIPKDFPFLSFYLFN